MKQKFRDAVSRDSCFSPRKRSGLKLTRYCNLPEWIRRFSPRKRSGLKHIAARLTASTARFSPRKRSGLKPTWGKSPRKSPCFSPRKRSGLKQVDVAGLVCGVGFSPRKRSGLKLCWEWLSQRRRAGFSPRKRSGLKSGRRGRGLSVISFSPRIGETKC